MKLQTGATQVATRTAQLMRAKRVGKFANDATAIKEPIWFRSVLAHAPTHDILPKVRLVENPTKKTDESEFFITRNPKNFSTNPKHLYKLEQLKFQEDEIRQQFYSRHPWELAHPRSMVEQNDETAINRDWSTIDQPDLALSGESVVQRTLYLIKHQKSQEEAYAQAVAEFIRLRIRQQAESDVAAEEAMMFGAIIDQSAIQHGIEREQEVIDVYAVEAKEATKALEGQQVTVNVATVEQPKFEDAEEQK